MLKTVLAQIVFATKVLLILGNSIPTYCQNMALILTLCTGAQECRTSGTWYIVLLQLLGRMVSWCPGGGYWFLLVCENVLSPCVVYWTLKLVHQNIFVWSPCNLVPSLPFPKGSECVSVCVCVCVCGGGGGGGGGGLEFMCGGGAPSTPVPFLSTLISEKKKSLVAWSFLSDL